MGAGRVLGVHRGRVAVAAVASAILISALGAAPAAFGATPAADCQPFGNRPCLLPFPDNRFSKADPTSATGLRVQMPQTGDADQHGGRPDQGRGVQPQRRVQPRQHDRRPHSGARQPHGAQQDEPRPADGHVPGVQARGPDRGDRREDRQSTPDLGRARFERQRCRPHHAADPPRPELRLRAALHRRPPEPEGQERERAPGAELVRGAPRQPAGQQHLPAPAPALRLDLQHAQSGGDPAPQPL